jgi:endonuclease/exonuclease/phosphatase family metal-dependent hydrolase
MHDTLPLLLSRRGAPGRVACALGLALALLTAAPAAFAETPLRLRVLTWNVWGLPAVSTNLEARLAMLPEAIAKLDPDVILLQELWIESDGDRLKQSLEQRGYPYASHLAHTKYGMTGLFTASKLPLKNSDYHPFASGQIGHSFWHLEWLAAKGVGTFVIQTPLGELAVQNTHLQAQYDTDLYAAERLSQASEILLIDQQRTALPLVLGGDFNTGAEELPRQALFDLDGLSDTTPSPRPDTIYVRSGGSVAIHLVDTRQAFTEPVRLQNGVTTELSDHPAVVVDLELSACASCAPASVAKPGTRDAARSLLIRAAGITPFRVTLALSTAASLLLLGVSLFRRKGAPGERTWQRVTLRRASLALLATGFVWTSYLGALYYPARAKALRLVADELGTMSDKSSAALR